jgi:mono/diheme cytochrome c family protein
MRRGIILLSFLLLAGGASGVQAQTGDAKKGRAFAEKTCAACHAIDRDQLQSGEPDAPSFQAIANSPGISWIALSVVLRTPHVQMPNLVLSPQEQADVIEYILSLKN